MFVTICEVTFTREANLLVFSYYLLKGFPNLILPITLQSLPDTRFQYKFNRLTVNWNPFFISLLLSPLVIFISHCHVTCQKHTWTCPGCPFKGSQISVEDHFCISLNHSVAAVFQPNPTEEKGKRIHIYWHCCQYFRYG